MANFNWNDKFCVNNDRMDEHHKRLFYLMNRLDGAISANIADKVVGHTIEELVRYAAEHFKAEEKLMEAIHHPEMENHRAMHKFFADEAALLSTMYKAGEMVRVQSIAQFLRDWFIYHIFSEDRKYGKVLEQQYTKAA